MRKAWPFILLLAFVTPSTIAGDAGTIPSSGREANTLVLRGMLARGQYDALNTLLGRYQAEADANVAAEEQLFRAFDAFRIADPAYERLLADWVNATPNAWQPYVARAGYYRELGWEARGGKWASETAGSQFTKMDEHFANARRDIAASLRLNDRCMVPYATLINISMAHRGNGADAKAVLDKALKIQPASFRVRRAYMYGLTPRWGGSFDEMRAFATAASPYAARNPNLTLLQGMVLLEAGKLRALDRVYSEAETLYTRALEFGDNPDVLLARGENRYRREQYDLALSDLQRAIGLAPENADNYYWLSNVHEKQKAYDLAAEDIAIAARLDPVDQHILDQQKTIVARLVYEGYELSQARKSAEALAKYTVALRLSPEAFDIYNRRARTQIDLNHYDPALEDIKRAIQLNPDHYDSYQLLDWLLAQRRDWDQIIQYWSQYIARNPDDGRAYVERGGARYRKGDLRGAVTDAKSSADLGNPQGKEAYRRFAPLLR